MEVRVISRVLLVALLDHCLSASADVSACLDAQNHKNEPGPESSLYGHCTPWKDRACCTEQTTHDVHHKDMYSMSLDFCEEQTGRKMSPACREHFHKDLCFYECEPNIGPWIVKVNRKIGKERFFEVPLCYSDCLAWWNDCRNDYACTPNWPRGFVLYGGSNHCPKAAACVTFEKMYSGPADFCSKVWDHSWKVVPDDTPCMHMWFNDTHGGNPNKATAEYYYRLPKPTEYPRSAAHVVTSAAAQFLLLATSTAVLALSAVFQSCWMNAAPLSSLRHACARVKPAGLGHKLPCQSIHDTCPQKATDAGLKTSEHHLKQDDHRWMCLEGLGRK